MSQRVSGYERKKRDLYETPEWVTLALAPHLPRCCVWEPASASGKMVMALEKIGFEVVASDIETGTDFLTCDMAPAPIRAIITNPPYELATDFINHALNCVKRTDGFVAMLLRCDFDHAKTRSYLFGDNKAFAKKLVLTKRIKWFEGSTGQPSFNHAWFIWDRQHKGPPVLAYGPANTKGE